MPKLVYSVLSVKKHLPLKTWHYAAPFTSDSHIPPYCWPQWLNSGRDTTIDNEEDTFPTRSFRLVLDQYGFSLNIVCDYCESGGKSSDVHDWCKAAPHSKRCLPIAVFSLCLHSLQVFIHFWSRVLDHQWRELDETSAALLFSKYLQ